MTERKGPTGDDDGWLISAPDSWRARLIVDYGGFYRQTYVRSKHDGYISRKALFLSPLQQMNKQINKIHGLYSTSWPVNSGRRFRTSSHVSSPSTSALIACTISSSLARTCFVVSRSRKVKVLSFTDWKSTVIPNGVPSSSLREYRLPILAEESSTRLEIPIRRSLVIRRLARGANVWWVERGTIRTLVGAITGGKERT